MQATKEFLLDFPAFFGKAVAEIREEQRELIRAERENWLPNGIVKLHQIHGASAIKIAEVFDLTVEYVQSILDKNAS